MKNVMKRSFAVLMTLVMCASMFFGLTFSAQAAETPTVNYVYDGSYVYNWGERGTKAEFLSPMAIEFYSANGTTLDGLLALDGSASESGVPSSALFGELHELMESNHDYITSYNATKNLFQYTDCQNSGGKISSFYSGTAIGPSWDGAWNREHVWPNSKGDEAGNGENDLMMLRPTSTSENSSRGNKAYGTATTTSYYNPNDEGGGAYDLRGDVARIILYQYVRWECTNTGSSYNSSSIFGSDGVIESQDVLLDWIEADPVDTWEMGRNDAAESILGTRNVFVDYPELAFDLFNEAVPTDYTSPSGGTSVEGDSSGSTGDNTGDDTTGEEVVAPETATYVFSNYTAGTQYANESLTLDDIVTATSYNSNCHFTTQLRMYNSNTSKSGGMVILSSKSEISSISLNAGYKATSLAIYSSSDGSTWSSPTSLTLTTSYKDFSVDLPAGTKYVKIENSGTAQARIASITLTFAATSNDDTSDDKVYVDSNGVIVSGSADAFPEDTTITVTPITSGDAFDTATSALDGIASKFTAYDVTPSATLNEGAVVKLTLDIPDGYDADHVCIAHIDENGVVELLSSEIDKTANTVSAEVEHFSTYAVVDTSEASSEGDEGTTTTEIVFEFGDKVDSTTHKDGSDISTSKSYTNGDYTLTLTNASKCYDGGNDATGNSTLKLGTGSVVGSFTITVPDNVTSVIFKVAKYKANATTVDINGTEYTITGSSDSGVYDSITVDTTATKTITFTTVTKRCMIDSITYVITGSSGGETPETPTYTVTAESNNTSYGTVTLSGNVITAKAKSGYTVSGYTADPEGAATVTDNGDGTFTVSELTANVLVTINFEALPTYTVQFSENGTLAEPLTKYAGGEITLPEHTSAVPDGYEFEGWAEAENETDYAKIFAAGTKYTVTRDITLYAQYSEVSSTPTSTVTIDFTTTEDRVSQSTSQQIWSSEGATVTNNKASAQSNVVADVNPAKFYAGSDLIINCNGMTQIVITSSSSTYATPLQTTIEDGSYPDVKRVSVSGSVVTIEFNSAIDSFTITKLAKQVRVNTMVITKEVNSTASEYTVTYIENGEETASTTLAEGTVITLPNDTATPSDKNFVGWATVENAASDILSAGASHTVNSDVTFYAQYTDKIVETATHDFVKVTEDQTDWTGTYLIVYEEDSVAFNGSLTSLKTANGLDVSIVDSKIKATDSALAASFTIEAIEGGYAIKSSSGYYIGRTSANTDSNDLLFNQSTQYVNSISLSDGNVNVVSGNTYLRWNASSSFFRYYKSGTYTDQQPIALYKLDVANISGAQVTVGADLTMKYYVDVTNIENVNSGDLTMRFSIDGEVIDTVSGTVVGSQYVFDFAGLAPQRMADIIKAEVLFKGTLIDVKDNYSIRANAQNLLDANTNNTKLTQFITDMLYYGDAAQKYTKYNTDNLATSGVKGLGTQSTATPDDAWAMSLTNNSTPDTVYFRAATVWFDSVNKLIIKLNSANKNTQLYVNDKLVEINYDSETGVYSYTTDEILVTEFDTVYTFKLYDNNTLVQTLNYSVNAYAYSKQNSNNMANLALALYRMGVSADAYVKAQ